jgi:hypothetical protein
MWKGEGGGGRWKVEGEGGGWREQGEDMVYLLEVPRIRLGIAFPVEDQEGIDHSLKCFCYLGKGERRRRGWRKEREKQ